MRNRDTAHRDTIAFIATLALAAVALLVPTAAKASFLDDGFGESGMVDLDAAPNDVVVDRTGRILVALDGGGSIVVAAFDESGAPDMSFGDDGVATVDLGDDATAVALAVDPANRIAVGATHAAFDGAVVRLTPSGQPDPSYDDDGVDFTNGPVSDVLTQPDSKVVVLGIREVNLGDSGQYYFRFARYTATGSRDISFSGDGILEAPAGGPSSAGLGGGEVAIGPDGSLVALAYDNPCCQPNLRAVLTKVTSSGTVIAGFGTGETPGVARHRYYSSPPSGLAVHSDGKVLFAGSSPDFEFSPDYAMAQAVRLLADGTLDTSWGSGGAAAANFLDGSSRTTDLTLMADGRVVLSAHAVPASGGEAQLAVARFLPSGALDLSFGLDGMASTPYPALPHLAASDLTVDALGRPILAASRYSQDVQGYVDPVLMRFLSSGGSADDGGGGGGEGPPCGNEGQPSCCDEANPCIGDPEGDVAGGVAGKGGRVGLRVHRIVVPKSAPGLLRRGIRVLASCSEKCRVIVNVSVSGAVANAIGLSRTMIARGTSSAAANKRRWVVARLTPAAIEALRSYRGGSRLRVRVRAVGAAGAQSATATVAG